MKDIPDQPLKAERKAETGALKSRIQEAVAEYTTLKRAEQVRQGVPPEHCIRIDENYDPVVRIAVLAVKLDQPNLHDMVAKYVQPTLKSIEVLSDEQKAADNIRRSDAAAALLRHLDRMDEAARDAYEREHPGHGAQDAPKTAQDAQP